MLGLFRAFVPKPLLRLYHWLLAAAAVVVYGFPSRRLIVIGVTGTTGKSTVVNLIEYLLSRQGYAVGMSSTPLLSVAGKRWTNAAKMTMPGRFALQRHLRRIVAAGCRYAVLEMTSEGLAQHRGFGIDVDIAVLTNLTPEHLESHGSFAAYREAKGKLFRKLAGRRKLIASRRIAKVAVVNGDDPQANFFLRFPADERVVFRTAERTTVDLAHDATVLTAQAIRLEASGVRFRIGRTTFRLPSFGRYAVSNSLAAIAVCQQQGITLEAMQTLLAAAPTVPGRMEFVSAGQTFSVIVDYAHEPVSLESFYAAVRQRKPKRLLAVLGATGGGRDTGKRPILGEIAAKNCDLVFVTNEDPYDDDPIAIIEQVAAGAERAGAVRGQTLFTVPDRRQAIDLALRTARPGDAVLLTGKGNEPWIVERGGKKIPWDERQVVRDLLEQVVDKSREKERSQRGRRENPIS